MINKNLTGLFGKLPAHGDFIYRDLPTRFINVWDNWLQGFVGSTQEQMGESWLDIYMTSPIWRFAFSAGVVDENCWAGILLPSVDRVGRYFPFTVATKLPANLNPAEFMSTRPNWFQAMEDSALRALDGQLQIDDLVEELNDSQPMTKTPYQRGEQLNRSSHFVVKIPNSDQPVSTVIPFMLDACLVDALQSYSLWSTSGSERMNACMFTAKGLPPLSGIAAMMDGQWNHWNWKEPFPLKNGF